MNPGVSFTSTGNFRIDLTNSTDFSSSAASAQQVRTISTSGITVAGLKKWSPTRHPGLRRPAAMAVTLSEDVFVAITASPRILFSISARSAFFASRASTIASTIQSASAAASSPSSTWMEERESCICAADIFPFLTRSARDFSIPARMRGRAAGRSTIVVSYPERAQTRAIPCPIVPPPITSTFFPFSIALLL